MLRDVEIIAEARQDLEELWDYVLLMDGLDQAEALLSHLEVAIMSLSNFPERGAVAPALAALGRVDYRELHVKNFRIIFQVFDTVVMVHCVMSSRRNAHDLLQQRLLQRKE